MNRICDILFLVKASNTAHATSKEMKTDELTIKENKNAVIYSERLGFYSNQQTHSIGLFFIFNSLIGSTSLYFSLHFLYQKLLKLLTNLTNNYMYDTSLCALHTDTTWEPSMTISVNTPPMISLRGSGDDESYLDSKLQFDWSHDAKFFFRNGLLKFGL